MFGFEFLTLHASFFSQFLREGIPSSGSPIKTKIFENQVAFVLNDAKGLNLILFHWQNARIDLC